MENALKIQELLNSYGHKTLAAGGFVRDFLLKREPKDIDLATSAFPEQVLSILGERGINCIPTGLKHGTITAVMDKMNYEITTLRVDKICHGREAEVEFVKSFEEDSKRRDLTINALYMDLSTSQIYDYVGGERDLSLRILKFVGDPEKRIKEDFLRILRFYRFQSQLNFEMDNTSIFYCEKYLPYLCYVSLERIRDELCKMIVGCNAKKRFYMSQNMIGVLLPELIPSMGFNQKGCYYHYLDVYEHTLKGIHDLIQYQDPVLSFAHLFHDVSKPFCQFNKDGVDHFYGHEVEGVSVVERAMSRLKFPSKDIARAKFLVRNHMRLNNQLSKKALRRLLNDCEEAGDRNYLVDLWRIHHADCSGMINQTLYPEQNITEILTEKPDVFKCPLSGKEIMSIFSLPEGPDIGFIRKYLKEEVIEGKLDSEDREGAIKLVNLFMENKCK